MPRIRPTVLAALAAAGLAATTTAQDDAKPARVDFIKQVQPILKEQCYKCHGSKKQEGDIRFDLRSGTFGADQDLWPIVPGEPDDSILIERITLPADDPDIMPNEGDPLTKEQIAVFRQWI